MKYLVPIHWIFVVNLPHTGGCKDRISGWYQSLVWRAEGQPAAVEGNTEVQHHEVETREFEFQRCIGLFFHSLSKWWGTDASIGSEVRPERMSHGNSWSWDLIEQFLNSLDTKDSVSNFSAFNHLQPQAASTSPCYVVISSDVTTGFKVLIHVCLSTSLWCQHEHIFPFSCIYLHVYMRYAYMSHVCKTYQSTHTHNICIPTYKHTSYVSLCIHI